MVIIRKARTDEAHIIVHHRTEMIRSMGWSEEDIAATRRATVTFLSKPWDPSIECYFAVDDGKVVGGCAVSFCVAYPSVRNPSGKFAYLYNMFVEPECRGKGVATSIVTYITKLCQDRGVEKMTLHDTKMSRGIYEREGFAKSENYYTKFIGD